MDQEIKIAIIGLDTSHSIEFTRLFQGPDCPPGLRVSGLRVTACLRFETPFQNRSGLDARQKQLESWGVKVTEEFDAAVADCDAVMLEINDPALHREYFEQAAALGRPIFLDKPLAGSIADGRRILRVARERGTRTMSCSSLRFASEFQDALKQVPAPRIANIHGGMGKAAAGDSLIWYGVHSFEMLERALGRGAARVTARENDTSVVSVVEYPDGREGIVETHKGLGHYGGRLMIEEKAVTFSVDMGRVYFNQLGLVRDFFNGLEPPLALEDAFEVLALMDAARRSIDSGKPATPEQP